MVDEGDPQRTYNSIDPVEGTSSKGAEPTVEGEEPMQTEAEPATVTSESQTKEKGVLVSILHYMMKQSYAGTLVVMMVRCQRELSTSVMRNINIICVLVPCEPWVCIHA